MNRNLLIPALLLLAALAVLLPWGDIVAPLVPDVSVEPGPRWVVVIEKSEERQGLEGAAIADTTDALQLYCDKNGHTYRSIDESSAPDWAGPWIEKIEAAGRGYPAVVIVEKDTGKWLHAGRLPPAGDSAIELVKRWGG